MQCTAVRGSDERDGESCFGAGSHEKSWWRLSRPLCFRRGQGCGHMQSASPPASNLLPSFLPSCLPLSPFRPSFPLLACLQPSGRHRLLPLEWLRKPLLWKGYCMQPARNYGRKEGGRKERANERMTRAFVGKEDNGE